jgi:hypothetical protein
MAKARTPLPDETAAVALFISDHTCCVCREPGKPVQIHHINEDPTLHEADNLAVLCLICHDQTMLRGGFSRRLRAEEVIRYRDDWLERVQRRRDLADEIAALKQAGAAGTRVPTTSDEAVELLVPADDALLSYVSTLPAILATAYAKAQPRWHTGITPEMSEATSEVIDVLQQVWVHLASWFPPNHFGAKPAAEYFNDYIALRFAWQRALQEPEA